MAIKYANITQYTNSLGKSQSWNKDLFIRAYKLYLATITSDNKKMAKRKFIS